METEKAQQPEMILLDAPRRLADEAHPARFKIGYTTLGVKNLAFRRAKQRIHGEIAPS